MSKNNPTNLKYSKEHEWVRLEGDTAVCGITDHAQELLTDIVFVELPAVGKKVLAGKPVAALESVKSVSDVFSPATGEIIDVNKALIDHPEIINKSPFDDGWLFKIKLADVKELDKLMSADQYNKFIKE